MGARLAKEESEIRAVAVAERRRGQPLRQRLNLHHVFHVTMRGFFDLGASTSISLSYKNK
jgi:hypothetical protein